MKELKNCPVTGSELQEFLSCEDYLVSHETFKLWQNTDQSILITSPRPEDDKLGSYYESEDYISHTDSSTSLFDRVYQIIRNYALRKKLNLIRGLSEGRSLLDYGCGTGDFLLAAKQNGWTVEGVEPSVEAKSFAENKLDMTIKDPSVLSSFKDAQFDIITLWHVLEHVPNLMEVSRELERILKPGGHLILALPNFKSHDASVLKERWAAYDVPRHLWHFSTRGVEQLGESVGLQIMATKPMPFDAFYVALLSNKQYKGKINLFSSFFLGLKSNMRARKTNEWSSLIHVLQKPK